MTEKQSSDTFVTDIKQMPGVESRIAMNSILNMFEKSGFTEKLKGESWRIIRAEGYRENMDVLIKNSMEICKQDTVKLKQMVAYAYQRGCRRNSILEYFGDSREHAGCSACDNCLQLDNSETVTGKDLETVREILKAAKSLNGRLGIKKTAQFIKGSKAAWITERGYQHMDTYGSGHLLQGVQWT